MVDSRKKRDAVTRFGTASDRFRARKAQAPPVGNYSAKDNFDQNVFFRSSRRCIIGTEAGAGSCWNPKFNKKLQLELPGPGTYNAASDFDN